MEKFCDLPSLTVHSLGEPGLYVSDPELVQEMFVKKSALLDKTGVWERIFSPFFGN